VCVVTAVVQELPYLDTLRIVTVLDLDVIPDFLVVLRVRSEVVVHRYAPVEHRLRYLYLRLRPVEFGGLDDDERYVELSVQLAVLRQRDCI
jgi:hypothetical protein